MNYCRAYYDSNGSVVNVQWYNLSKGPRTLENTKKMKLDSRFLDCDYKEIESSIFDQPHEYTQQVYLDGEFKIDLNKERTLIPEKILRVKCISRLNSQIKSEIEKENPDFKLIKLNELQIAEMKTKHGDEKYWFKKALEGLDRRVSEGEKDKPLIRQKLLEKLR